MTTVFKLTTTNLSQAPAPSQHSATTPLTTPTELALSAHQLFTEIESIYNELRTIASLAPRDRVNNLLTRLVSLCISPHSTTFMSHFSSILGVKELCADLRPLCAAAEGELERHWARRIIDSTANIQGEGPNQDTKSLLHTFPYYQNYIDLSRLECSILEASLACSSTPPAKIAFIGSGPLPLTSLCVSDRYPNATVHNIDRDASALEVSQELCNQLGYGPRMTFADEDVSQVDSKEKKDWKTFEVVFLAALVGMDTHSKLSILSSLALKLQPGTLVVIRSAQGLRSVLYPVFELTDDIEKIGYEVLVESHPWTKVVNSIIVLRVKEE
ncbi:Nicotianamine synthase [Cucurbitaria berberidis CBS 394.84]|uniref:Nicotianamine synthase n=1 Tax=Cucurbitaria berberidis CBS 394.84 TaxID=1168544 RepID=A0A9P4GIW6_9PLEO|nr:Nicotianamine synthase [Cucurbitaria berberidis CBS 394.84]KAF1846284.1 Nicotianamine synthase [Cucurbitaria berberidis CBS 394.84]